LSAFPFVYRKQQVSTPLQAQHNTMHWPSVHDPGSAWGWAQ
jgi:hypothetical protein